MAFGRQDCFRIRIRPDQQVENRARVAAPLGGWPPAYEPFLVNGNLVRLVRDCLARTWWSGPKCGRRCKHLYLPELLCRICCGLKYSDHRAVPAVHRVVRLRRSIGAEPVPFGKIPRNPHARHRIHRIIKEIYAAEAMLIEQLHGVNADLDRRVRARK